MEERRSLGTTRVASAGRLPHPLLSRAAATARLHPEPLFSLPRFARPWPCPWGSRGGARLGAVGLHAAVARSRGAAYGCHRQLLARHLRQLYASRGRLQHVAADAKAQAHQPRGPAVHQPPPRHDGLAGDARQPLVHARRLLADRRDGRRRRRASSSRRLTGRRWPPQGSREFGSPFDVFAAATAHAADPLFHMFIPSDRPWLASRGRCRKQGVFVPASRVCVPVGEGSDEIANRHGLGFWNEPSPSSRLPAHRVVNQTSDCPGPTLVILKDELPGPLPGLAEAAALSTSGGGVAFSVGRTLRSKVALPSAVAIPLLPAPPPERDTPEARTASAEGRVEGFAAAAQAGEASGSGLEAGLEPFLAEISLALGPLAEAGAPPPPGPGEMTWHFGGGSPIDDLLLSGSATPPLLQTRPTPAASVPPPSMPPSPPAVRISLRLDVVQSKPVQLSLALLVMFAARLAELDTTNPAAFIAAAGFGLLALANLAQASPRCLARVMALVLVCAPTLRLVSVLVRSPEGMARDLDKFAGAGRCLLTFCAACGAAFGALPPSALPPTRKLLAVGYCACVQMCVGFILRVRTGDERALSFYLLRLLLPFLASFLAAQAASGRSLGQHAPPLPLGGACSRSPNRSLSRRHCLVAASSAGVRRFEICS
mmetsp:Transcript_44458/g.145717  ORF Transcript_44458/g.145717 Transcript_44458/m.145717 type:complete len:655 (-) Transcript_44458:322-2286(-)